ncbi:TlpA family protein disulfide reductase [Alteromonas aestuariivivens]|uniref:TlpA family protein disulfide reductase n=1 Tax=Alteromonas aestuariivivens TaxID=1938339 RepID=UPI001FE72778|nr:TlpA disulfide reductase family protein [Alteromonas aestuariivivens]
MQNKVSKGLGYLAVALLGVLAAVAGVVSYQAGRVDFETVTGKQYRWETLEQQWVVVNYFAEWCSPCLKEIPELNHFFRTRPGDVQLFGVSYDLLSVADVQALKQKYHIEYDLIVADENTRLPVSKPQYLPATFVIGPDGTIAAELMGEISSKRLVEVLEKLKSKPL